MSECCGINLTKQHAGVCRPICINRPTCCGLNRCTATLNKFISDQPSNAIKPLINASLLP